MELRNCVRCGKAYVYTGNNLCMDCVQEDEEDFALLRELLEGEEDYSVKELSEKSGVEEAKIIQFLRQGRLKSEHFASEVVLTCEKCGSPVSEGRRLCSECAEGFTKEADTQVKKQGRMHIADRLRNRRRRR